MSSVTFRQQRRRLRPSRAVTGLGSLVLSLALVSGCLSPGQTTAFDSMNRDRVALRREPLLPNGIATAKAQAWAEHLVDLGHLQHSVLADGFRGVAWCELGENIGYGADPIVVENAYMQSPGHRRNILDPKWESAGVGYYRASDRVYTVQIFVKMC